MIQWVVEDEDDVNATLVHSRRIIDHEVEVRVSWNKVMRKYRLRLITVKPIDEMSMSLLSTLTSTFSFTLDYSIDDRMALLNPDPVHHVFESLESMDLYIETIMHLLNEVLTYSSDPLASIDFERNLVSRGWILYGRDSMIRELMRLYNKGGSVVKVEVFLTQTPLELGKVNVSIMIKGGLGLQCMIENLSRWGFDVELSYEPLGIAYLTGSFPSMGLVTAIADRIEKMIDDSTNRCGTNG